MYHLAARLTRHSHLALLLLAIAASVVTLAMISVSWARADTDPVRQLQRDRLAPSLPALLSYADAHGYRRVALTPGQPPVFIVDGKPHRPSVERTDTSLFGLVKVRAEVPRFHEITPLSFLTELPTQALCTRNDRPLPHRICPSAAGAANDGVVVTLLTPNPDAEPVPKRSSRR